MTESAFDAPYAPCGKTHPGDCIPNAETCRFPDWRDHEVPHVIEPGTLRPPTHRFYMVGKLIRQDMEDPEPGYRETLLCPCHEQPIKMFGPLRSYPRYAAYCTVNGNSDLLAEEVTMEEIWSAVEHKRELQASMDREAKALQQ